LRLKPAQKIDHETLAQKIALQKRAGGVAKGVSPEFKPQYLKINKQKTTIKGFGEQFCGRVFA
jgi:hypothetical protein